MIKCILVIILLSPIFSQNEIEGRWHLVGFEDAIMYQFVDTEPFADAGLRYSIYVDENGEFDNFDDDNVGGTPHPYSVSGDIITIDTHFGNIISYQMIYRCDGQVVDFVYTPDGIIHSTLFREGYSYINNTCEEYGDINIDNQINIVDVVLLVSYILEDSNIENGDINQDGLLNVIDVVLLVDIILNQEIVPETGLFISQQFQEDELIFFYDLVYSERANMNGLQYSSSLNSAQDQLLDTILLELDIALPPNPENKPLPLIVVIHGGGFSGGSKESRWQDTKDYASLGYIGCTINYRLTPHSYQDESEQNQLQAVVQAVEDAMNSIRYLKTQSSVYNIDTNRIITIGKSDGGFISLVNAIENDIMTDFGGVSDYIDISSRVSSSISTGAVIPIESFNFDEDDASCLIMHSEDYDPVTERTWEGDVIPFYEAVISSGNHAVLVPQPSNSHVVPISPLGPYRDDIIPFIWDQLNLDEW